MLGGSPASLRALGIAAADGAAIALRRAQQPCSLRTTAAGAAAPAAVAGAEACPSAASKAAPRAAKAAKAPKPAAQAAAGAAPKKPAVPARALSGGADAPPVRVPASTKLPSGDDASLSLITYNVLLPNSKDGWWIYKYYREGDTERTKWPARQALLKQQLLTAAADFVCLQELSELSFEDDFGFLAEAGYQSVMHNKGRMRPATFWRTDRWESVAQLHKDRTLVVALRLKEGARAGTLLFLVNAHLSAGPTADRRMRQAHEAMSTIEKEAKKMNVDVASCPVVFCGDLNSMGQTGVRELLVTGEVGPDFRESGDPTEAGQQGKELTAKVKKQCVGLFADAAEVCFGEGAAPATIVASNIDSKMRHDNGELTQALLEALKQAFKQFCAEGQAVMRREGVDRWLLAINKEIGRGSEYRAAMAAMEKRGGEEVLTEEDFVALYAEEVAEGKFWGVEHDLRVILGRGMAVPSEGPCELCFDHIFFNVGTLRLLAVQEPLTEEQRKRIWGEPFDVLPNSWYPSDHLPVAAAFALR